ncbi:hypothetical protein VNI00_007537 [Paramarasmius palmivorus]|uniref:Uncharacterized protein n=1 Tax=Paramarasmius palmivorus TaxID=297713 RepID=A0AAW0D2J0_9AGAR
MPVPKARRSVSDDDPLTRAMAPPPNETPAQREERLQREKEAKERSDAIDNEINQQRMADKKEQAPVKVLLLAMAQALAQSNNLSALSPPRPSSPNRSDSPTHLTPVLPTLTAEHMKLKIRLSPLLQVEEALWRKLSPSSPPDAMSTRLSSVTNLPNNGKPREGAVYSISGWKGAFNKFLAGRSSIDSQNIDFDDPDDPGTILHHCAQDMIKLWNDPVVRKLLAALSLRLEDMPGL